MKPSWPKFWCFSGAYQRRLAFRTALVALLLPSLWAPPSLGAVLSTDGSAADTRAKIALAANGDIVRLPLAGAFTWDTAVSIPGTKWITLDLNGSIITLNGAAGTFAIHSSGAGSLGINRITNGRVRRGSGFNLYGGPFQIEDTRTGAGLRVDHLTFSGSNVLIDLAGRGAGVMDNCAFVGLSWAQEFIHIMGWGAADTSGWTQDTGATLAGSPSVFVIEDCTFTQDTSKLGVAWIQGYYGARIVIRHNLFSWVSIDMHGSFGLIGARWWEAYANTFDNDSSSGQPAWAFSIRAGSGVLHGNVMASGAGHPVNIGLCEEDSGYPADFQIGRGLNQTSDPAYVWNNGPMSLQINECDAPLNPGMVQLGRDVFASPRPGYTPFVYPHPLRTSDAGAKPAGPTSLRVTP